jgi:nucleotide-binding universal stress UspA family protein
LKKARDFMEMKILICYDGSDTAEAALDDLKIAGLPDETEALVMTIAEVWLPPPDSEVATAEYAGTDNYISQRAKKMLIRGERELHEAESLVNYAGQRLRSSFPNWQVKTEATYGSPAWEVITKADDWKPDLVVVGSHGRTAIGRLVLGSVSQAILTQAKCPVRIARGKIDVDEGPTRLIIGYDGSKGADKAIEKVASRKWPQKSEASIVTVDDPLIPMTIGRFVEPIASWVSHENEDHRMWIKKLAGKHIEMLGKAGLSASHKIIEGTPKQALSEEAKSYGADCIFVGATGFSNRFERFVLGSVSSSVAARAHCSVEVVR